MDPVVYGALVILRPAVPIPTGLVIATDPLLFTSDHPAVGWDPFLTSMDLFIRGALDILRPAVIILFGS